MILDRIDKIGRIEVAVADSSNPVNPVNPVNETPCLPSSATSVFSAAGSAFEYENAPGETVARRSTEAEAEFSVYGGTKGGAYSFELRDGGRLERAGGSHSRARPRLAADGYQTARQ